MRVRLLLLLHHPGLLHGKRLLHLLGPTLFFKQPVHQHELLLLS